MNKAEGSKDQDVAWDVAWENRRRDRVVAALSSIVMPLLEENPHLRIRFGEVVTKLQAETGYARALIARDLRDVSWHNIPVGENVGMKHRVEDGHSFLDAQLIDKPVISLEQ